MTDLYNDVMLRRWSVDMATGRAECLLDAVDVTGISPGARSAIEAKNDDVLSSIASAEGVEQGAAGLEISSDILALVRLRAGEASDEDREAVTLRWAYEVDLDAYGPVPDPVPDRVTSRQFFLQLEADGILDMVQGWISQQTTPVRIAFERSGTFVRSDEMLQSGFSALGFTSQRVDQFFAAAGQR